jgi:hypothetical protein
MVRGSSPGGGEIFCTRADQHRGPFNFLYNGYWVFFSGVRKPGRGVNHPPPSSTEVKERVELYLYSPSGSSWPVLGRTLPLRFVTMVSMETAVSETVVSVLRCVFVKSDLQVYIITFSHHHQSSVRRQVHSLFQNDYST